MDVTPVGADRPAEMVDLIVSRCPVLDRSMVTMLVGPGEATDRHVLLARDDDGALAACGLLRDLEYLPAGWRFAYTVTRGAAAGRGVASATYAGLLDLVAPEVERLVTMTLQDDPGSFAVARHWGFEPMQLSWTSSLDITAATDPEPVDGVRFEEGDDLCFPDEDAVEAVRDGAEMHVMYSGVDPRLRGHGLAVRTKQALHHAARAGVRTAITDNEENNLGIRRVNEQLGYRVRYGVHWMARAAG
ncbi:MAG: GNAT family N-acetyltransferase [Nocardioidaceae bacterium]